MKGNQQYDNQSVEYEFQQIDLELDFKSSKVGFFPQERYTLTLHAVHRMIFDFKCIVRPLTYAGKMYLIVWLTFRSGIRLTLA